MKKVLLSWLIFILSTGMLVFSQEKTDSLPSVDLQEVQIISTRAKEKMPLTYSDLDRKKIEKVNYGQDIPYLLMLTPSVVATSDAGTGIGYTGFRIRGTDANRINITANGVPVNDSESHGVFWVNIPDFASSIQDLQVQR
ncbi:MAG: Plug domain-containing protein, partial [Dysgonamonadaceae bacterium]|nr:Plug domain-containing protein [Dysgonamonadaceae bacterium]